MWECHQTSSICFQQRRNLARHPRSRCCPEIVLVAGFYHGLDLCRRFCGHQEESSDELCVSLICSRVRQILPRIWWRKTDNNHSSHKCCLRLTCSRTAVYKNICTQLSSLGAAGHISDRYDFALTVCMDRTARRCLALHPTEGLPTVSRRRFEIRRLSRDVSFEVSTTLAPLARSSKIQG
jgi:hypothetical protein